MKKVVVHADVSMVSTKHRITLSGTDERLLVDIVGRSAFYLPFPQIREVYQASKQSTYLDQEIQIRRNHRELLKVKQGRIAVDDYLGLLKILVRSLFA